MLLPIQRMLPRTIRTDRIPNNMNRRDLISSDNTIARELPTAFIQTSEQARRTVDSAVPHWEVNSKLSCARLPLISVAILDDCHGKAALGEEWSMDGRCHDWFWFAFLQVLAD